MRWSVASSCPALTVHDRAALAQHQQPRLRETQRCRRVRLPRLRAASHGRPLLTPRERASRAPCLSPRRSAGRPAAPAPAAARVDTTVTFHQPTPFFCAKTPPSLAPAAAHQPRLVLDVLLQHAHEAPHLEVEQLPLGVERGLAAAHVHARRVRVEEPSRSLLVCTVHAPGHRWAGRLLAFDMHVHVPGPRFFLLGETPEKAGGGLLLAMRAAKGGRRTWSSATMAS